MSRRLPRTQWCCRRRRSPTFTRLRSLVRFDSWPESRQSVERRGLQRPAQGNRSSSLIISRLRYVQSAIRDPNPTVFLENEMLYGVSFPMSDEAMSDNFLIPIGKCKVEREGSDVTIVAHSKMVMHSLEAAVALEKEGIKAEVINLRSIRPLDIETIKKSVKKTNRYVKCLKIYMTRPDVNT